MLLEYGLRLYKNGQPYVVEQRMCCTVENQKLAAIDMVCSGFRPEGVVETEASVHRFEAEDLGCGSGLPREFRARIGQIPVGHFVDVVTKDSAAKEGIRALHAAICPGYREAGQRRPRSFKIKRSD
ncbi:MAG: hypothetical protein ABSC23_06230 [Bryobacteraceae bacterium]